MPNNRVSDMQIDEVSLVDRPANQHSHILIAKRADQEDVVPDTQYFDADMNPVDEDELEIGDVVQDAEGNLYRWSDEDDEDDEVEEQELAEVGKSAFFEKPATESSVVATIRESLSKALANQDQEVLSKAFDAMEAIEKRAAAAEERSARLEAIAKREREIRLEREYVEVAKAYNVPIAPEELGPVLMRAAEALSHSDCAVLHKALTSSGEMLLTEAGFTGLAERDEDAELEAELEQIGKRGGEQLSKAQARTAYFDDHPEAYEARRAERIRNR